MTSDRWTGKPVPAALKMGGLRGQTRNGFMDKTAAAAEDLSDLADGLAVSAQLSYAVEVDLDWPSSGSQSFGFAIGDP